ncbi:hypothetical protein CCUS01_02946 [Colletotrichum cuscutae]|uniref:Uncharacterized protein n=1 Tax=Colletotrichum cuscutae TaxID=1209917 RepID=A0AAI9YAR4_9PEZI|nr:hypothetical protein CCUS01_02946 [Colletotrichum cuscutae]
MTTYIRRNVPCVFRETSSLPKDHPRQTRRRTDARARTRTDNTSDGTAQDRAWQNHTTNDSQRKWDQDKPSSERTNKAPSASHPSSISMFGILAFLHLPTNILAFLPVGGTSRTDTVLKGSSIVVPLPRHSRLSSPSGLASCNI